MKNVLSVKDNGGKEIIVELGLAVIAVALLILFRQEIATLVKNIMNRATSEITNMFSAAAAGNAI